MASLRVSTVLTFLLTEQMLLAYILLPELRDRFWTLLAYLLIIATTCLATSTIGLMCSALARRTSTAMVLTYLTLLVLFVVPLGLELYLRGISSVTEEQLAAFTVTSPFSAAMGVPMHTTRNEIWSDKPLSVPDPGAGEDRGELRPAGLGDFPLHLPTALPGVLRRHVPRVSLALVAGRGHGVGSAHGEARRCRRPRSCHVQARAIDFVPGCAARQRSVFEIPHIVGPADQADRRRNRVDRPGGALAANRDIDACK